MDMRHLVRSSVVGLLLFWSTANLGAAGRSDVADAVMRGDTAAVRTLLAQQVDVNAPQAGGATALHWAVYREDLATSDLLIRAGADVKVANREGTTPLALACISGNAVLIERLLKAGADANERRALGGETALMMASRTGRVAAMQVLLDHGAEVNSKETLRGTTALMWAAAQGHPAAVQLLIARGADLHARSNPDTNFARAGAYERGVDPRPYRRAVLLHAARGQGRIRTEATMTQRRAGNLDGGGLTPLVYASRRGDLESARILLAANADVNQVTEYGWSPLLVAIHNRNYQLASLLLDKGADPTLANKGGWTPLYLAVDNRNVESGDYPVRQADMDHLDFIKKLLTHGADKTVNATMKANTERRTVFRVQWVNEDGQTAFLRAAESNDLELMRLLLAHGADPSIPTSANVTALQLAAGIGWVEGLTYDWSEQANVEVVKLLLALGADPNAQADTGRTALMGAAHKGRTSVIQLLVDAGAKIETRDYGLFGDEAGGRLIEHTWQAVDYADGLIRFGTQSPTAQPAAGLLLRNLMKEAGLYVPPMNRTIESVCVTSVCE
jgi:ankyrin repeat protein